MKALTIWQPWASLIMAGAKPFEFRQWAAPRWMIGRELVIHAGARPIRRGEVEDLLARLADDREVWTTGLIRDKAMPVLERALAQATRRTRTPAPAMLDLNTLHGLKPLPMSAGLGTVRMGEPVDGYTAAEQLGHAVNDSDRVWHANWGWPMLEVAPFRSPIACRGLQGFWNWPTPASLGLLP